MPAIANDSIVVYSSTSPTILSFPSRKITFQKYVFPGRRPSGISVGKSKGNDWIN